MVKLDVEHVIIIIIVAFVMYHLSSCRCFNNGFNVGIETDLPNCSNTKDPEDTGITDWIPLTDFKKCKCPDNMVTQQHGKEDLYRCLYDPPFPCESIFKNCMCDEKNNPWEPPWEPGLQDFQKRKTNCEYQVNVMRLPDIGNYICKGGDGKVWNDCRGLSEEECEAKYNNKGSKCPPFPCESTFKKCMCDQKKWNPDYFFKDRRAYCAAQINGLVLPNTSNYICKGGDGTVWNDCRGLSEEECKAKYNC